MTETAPRVLPSGERAVLLEVADAVAAHRLADAVRALADPRCEDVVAAACTVLVVATDPAHLQALTAAAAAAATSASAATAASVVRVPVRYDGEDLAAVAALTGMSTDEVVQRHTAATYTVEFVGFAPGFGYLRGLDPALHVRRLDSPRPRVPAGAVAIAGRHAAVYPRASPGGWRLLGSTDLTLFDVTADPPALLQAGTEVRFEPR